MELTARRVVHQADVLSVPVFAEVVVPGELAQFEGGEVVVQGLRIRTGRVVEDVERRVLGAEEQLRARSAAVGEGDLAAAYYE